MKRTPLRRNTPLRADPEKTREWQDRSRRENPLERRTPLRARSFSEAHADDPRYGPEFEVIRDMECFCVTYGYSGPGHERCGPGSRGLGHTAAHLAADDDRLMVPACGAAHDLVDGYGSATTVRVFREWCAEQEWGTLDALAARYWREVT